ncbi:hypothetical protein RBU55_11040 [Pseudomonas chlororaphis subsp. aurantiaca]|uniref:hypothetical protein n=1 Tax=Pseudomonas chlororaphis TaxID=587753 RepID=UPI0027DD411E|nr:hypothetical protein [Pseudomonas chlororaphis]WMJ02054.1 hypothetical protein RBU55_11040 [Pseudomonas chlororaphis subsp. aurantiaca]
MLLLKIIMVPGFLLLISLASRRWGPSIAGWLAGFPVVVGPILFFLAVEQGHAFAAQASVAALSALLAMIAFGIAYAQAAQKLAWPWALAIAVLVWAILATLISWAPGSLAFSVLCAAIGLLAAPYLFPRVQPLVPTSAPKSDKLIQRMLAGALLTLTVTWLASTVGYRWSGLLAVFPVLASVLAVFSHRSQGPAFTAVLLRATATGLYSFAAFCLVLALALPSLGLTAFVLGVAVSLAVLGISKRLLARSSTAARLSSADA